ncbi:hypothetical protein LINPERHAP2_LOCUS14112 [Linum perenne]
MMSGGIGLKRPSWVGLFGVSPDLQLEYVESIFKNGILQIPNSILELGAERLNVWEKFLPIWVRLSKVPPPQQTKKGLSMLVSPLGEPMNMAKLTSLVTSTSAKVCVQISSDSGFPDSIPLEIEDEEPISIKVVGAFEPEVVTVPSANIGSVVDQMLVIDQTTSLPLDDCFQIADKYRFLLSLANSKNVDIIAVLETQADQKNLAKEDAIMKNWMELRKAEKSIMKQKARDLKINLGDSNTSYFHKAMKVRRAHNKILKLVKPNGEEITTMAGITNEAIYF